MEKLSTNQCPGYFIKAFEFILLRRTAIFDSVLLYREMMNTIPNDIY